MKEVLLHAVLHRFVVFLRHRPPLTGAETVPAEIPGRFVDSVRETLNPNGCFGSRFLCNINIHLD